MSSARIMNHDRYNFRTQPVAFHRDECLGVCHMCGSGTVVLEQLGVMSFKYLNHCQRVRCLPECESNVAQV